MNSIPVNSNSHADIYKINVENYRFQELQEQVNDLDNRVSEDNMSYNLKQIQQDLVQMKSLVNKDAPVQELNNTIQDNKKSFSKLESLMQNIYHILNTIDAKLNRTDLGYYPMNGNDKYQPYAHRFVPVEKTNLKHSHNADELNSTVHGKDSIEETKNADIIEDIILQMLSDNNSTQSSGTYINNMPNEDEPSQQLIDQDKDKRKSFLTRFNYTLIDKENKQDTDIYRTKNNTHVKETIQSNIENISDIPIKVETNDQIKFMENNSDNGNTENKLQNQNIITFISPNNTDVPIIKPISDTTQSNKKPGIKINNKHITYYSTLSLLKQRQNLTNLFKDFRILINNQNTSRNNFEEKQNITIIPKDEERIIISGENMTNISERDLNLTIPVGTLNNDDEVFNVTSNNDSETGVQAADVLNTTDVREHFRNTGLTNETDGSEEKMVPLNLTDILYDDNFNIANNTTQFQNSIEYTDIKYVTNEDGFSELVSDIPEIQEYEDDYFD